MRVRRLDLLEEGTTRLVAVADSHSEPHRAVSGLLRSLSPLAVIHAGDVGAPAVLDELSEIAPVVAVRGNVDPRSSDLPEMVKLELLRGGEPGLTALVVHIGVSRTRLLKEVRRIAQEQLVQLVICGHSHVPFLGLDGEIAVFNPGSIGPRRFGLPTTLGLIEVSREGVELRHLDCETGRPWRP